MNDETCAAFVLEISIFLLLVVMTKNFLLFAHVEFIFCFGPSSVEYSNFVCLFRAKVGPDLQIGQYVSNYMKFESLGHMPNKDEAHLL